MATILVIDDEQITRSILHAVLEEDGHQVLEASNGRVGLALYQERHVDLIITDIVMPEMSGIDLMLELTRKNHNVKVIAISAGLNSDRGLRVATALGARRTFHKPFNVEEIRRSVRDVLAH